MNKFIAIIPARSGSKGLKSKNTLIFNNKPLIYWTINAALKSASESRKNLNKLENE